MARQHGQAIVIDALEQQPPEGDAGFDRRRQLFTAEKRHGHSLMSVCTP
jgi:hypothetical protein